MLNARPAVARTTSGVLFLTLAGTGVLVLLFFGRLLITGRLASLSLPLLAVVAAVASVFNPCSLPALPAFLVGGGGGAEASRPPSRLAMSFAVSLGAISLVLAFAIPVSFVGMEVQFLIAPHFSWAQIGLGTFLVALGALHLLGQTFRLPLMGRITRFGSRMWEAAVARPNMFGGYLFGVGFVTVGGT